MSIISNYISQHLVPINIAEQLPLMHSCECFDSRNIFESGQIEARSCKVFGEKLLYFFYGKPSYPVGEKIKENRTDIEYCPVCFIVSLDEIEIYKVFPFDTGAFKANRYAEFLHRNMRLDDFELTSSRSGIQEYIQIFFGNNQNYIQGEAIIKNVLESPCVKALVSILNATSNTSFDERANTVEVISHKSILLKDAVECVILPENLLRDSCIEEYLSKNGISHMEYTVRKLTAPSRYNEVVFDRAMEYIKKRGGI